MRDVVNLAEDGRVQTGFIDLALEVIRRLAEKRNLGGECLLEGLVSKLFDAVKNGESSVLEEVMRELRAANVSAESVVIDYIPEVARRLGVAWEQDTLSFSVVTTGTSRLQYLLHKASLDEAVDDSGEYSRSTILLVVPMGEQHTLGAMSAAAWLRMKGVSVLLKISPSPQELSQILQVHRFDGVFISVGSDSKAEVCAKLVKTLGMLSKGALPLVIGGPLAEQKRDDLSLIGADLVTTDLSEALAFVGSARKHRRGYAG